MVAGGHRSEGGLILATLEVAAARGAGRRHLLARLALLGPGVTTWLLLFVAPVGLLLASSFRVRGPYGGFGQGFTLANYGRLLDPLYLDVFIGSLRIATLATAIALLLGYPAALAIATASKRIRVALVLLVVLPFWTSFLIRTYAWMVILNPAGLANRLLAAVGLGPAPLLYNDFAIILGLVYAYLPLMVLPIYSAIERLGPQVREAAADLYAPPPVALLRVLVPLTLPGIAAGAVFVFVPSLGNFIVPDLLGGGRTIMIGNLMQQQFLQTRDWPFGAVMALTVVALMLVLVGIQTRTLREPEGTRGA